MIPHSNVNEVCNFLGFVTYYSKFIPIFATIIQTLLKNKTPKK